MGRVELTEQITAFFIGVEETEWAKAKADWYDPTVAREDEFFGKREHEKDAEKKKLNYKGYWW